MKYISMILVLFSMLNVNEIQAKDGRFDKIINTICRQQESRLTRERLKSYADKHLALLNARGEFSDIDYADTSITKWKPLPHLERLNDLVCAYTNPQSIYYADKDLYNNIVQVLETWYAKNPTSKNWWYNQIAVPKNLGLSLIQMRKADKKVPAELEKKLIDRMASNAGDLEKHVGANLSDIAIDYFYRACLTEDKEALERAVNCAYTPLKLVSADQQGLQYDYSFHQHGAQLHIGGYGEELIKGIGGFALNTIGSDYALSGEKLDILSRFVRDAYIPTLRGQYMHYNVMGRAISRVNISKKASMARFVENMTNIDKKNANEYKDAVRRMNAEKPADFKITPYNTLYPLSDYAIHTRSGYSFCVRAASERTSYIENGNKENLESYFMTFGCTSLLTNGNEYDNVFVAWDWRKVPGVTCPQVDNIPRRKEWEVPGRGKFVGGVSDSLYAVMAYAHEDEIDGALTEAKKSWFLFDNEIVCLGAGIKSASTFPINTTIEQSLLIDKVTAMKDNSETILDKGDHSGNISWIYHNGMGYIFPQGVKLNVSNKSKEGVWKHINNSQPEKPEKKDVFCLYLDHGVKPQDASYAYILVPNQKSATDVKSYKIDNIEIVSNTGKIQAVVHNGLGICQIVFFEAGKFTHNDVEVEVDKPCTVMLKKASKSSKASLHIADPAQTRSTINVKATLSNTPKSITADFSAGDANYAGFSKKYILD